MDDMGMPAVRERVLTAVSLALLLVAMAGYLAFSDGPIGTKVRAAVGFEDRVRPVVAVTSDGTHAFLNTQPDSSRPVGFSPCDEVLYVVNPTGAPRGWRWHVDTAVAEVEERTGLALTYLGTTDDRDFGERLDGSGPRPVLIGWADEREVGDLADDVAGIGGPTMIQIGDTRSYVTGAVVLDREATTRFESSVRGDRFQVALLMHELGHLVGLDHVDDPSELMHPDGLGRASYGPGDREGLARVGAIPCT